MLCLNIQFNFQDQTYPVFLLEEWGWLLMNLKFFTVKPVICTYVKLHLQGFLLA